MIYDIKYTERALEQIEKLDKNLQQRIFNSIDRLKINPFRKIEKLVNQNYFKLRIGDYRVLLKFENNIIWIVLIGHRKNIYKGL